MRNILEKIAEKFSGKGIDKKFPFFVWLYKKFFALFSSETEIKVSIPLGASLFVSAKDSGLGLTLRIKGKFEPIQTKKFTKSVRKGNIVFDVGANVGYYTVLASKLVGLKGKVYAFEPDLKNLSLLRKNLSFNGCKNVEVYPYALGSKDGQGLFLRDNSNPGESRVSNKKGKRIKIRTIDSFVKEKKIKKIDLLKVDVEGGEVGVLEGAKKTFSLQKDISLFIEANSVALSRFGYSTGDLKNLLVSLGFNLDRIIDEKSRENLKFSSNSFVNAQKKSSFVVLFGQKKRKNKNSKPLVSIIMTAFNAEKYIGEALRSLINQTYKNIEIIVVDDGSRDQTPNLVKGYTRIDERIKFFRISRNLGPSKASNFAIRKSRSEFIARMDADDIARPDRIEKQVRFLKGNLEVVIVGGQCDLIDEEGRVIGEKKFPTGHQGIYNSLFVINPIQHPSAMIRRKMLPKDFTFYHNHFVLSHDLELVFELAKYGRLANLEEKVLFYRKHLGSLSLKNPKETFKSTLNVRMKAILRYGYKPSLVGWMAHFVQTIVVFILPETFIFPLFSVFRGFSKISFRFIFPGRVAPALNN